MTQEGGGWELLAQVIAEGEYDPACERIDTAIKAVWLLYRRARWNILAELGLSRRQFEPVLTDFDLAYITSDHGTLRTESQVIALLRYLPPHLRPRLLYAALEMVRRYMVTLRMSRHHYYQGEEIA